MTTITQLNFKYITKIKKHIFAFKLNAFIPEKKQKQILFLIVLNMKKKKINA